jgi:hypothetical protein
MVKGTTRQVVMVRATDPKLFEQAIFILREDALARGGVSEEDVMQQAQKTAKEYLRSESRNRRNLRAFLLKAAWFLCGAAASAGVWLALLLKA